jgi:RNA polymerase sigma-70 factor (ECF subfamily)
VSLPASLTPEAICRDFAPRIFRVAMKMLNNETDAEDVTQEVLLQVVRKIETFRGESSLGTWLHKVTANAALALRRKRASHPERQLDSLGDGEPVDVSEDGRRRRTTNGPEQQVQRRELGQLIEEATMSLPEIYREVFILSDVEELPNSEIGRLLGLSLPAVKSRLHRARLLLRHALAPRLGEQHS